MTPIDWGRRVQPVALPRLYIQGVPQAHRVRMTALERRQFWEQLAAIRRGVDEATYQVGVALKDPMDGMARALREFAESVPYARPETRWERIQFWFWESRMAAQATFDELDEWVREHDVLWPAFVVGVLLLGVVIAHLAGMSQGT